MHFLVPPTGCAEVVCIFTVDNEIDFVKYNGNFLTISGGDINDWQKKKEISFQSCYRNSPGILEIKGTNWEENDHCKWAGLLMECTASHISSRWHNFVSDDNANWKSENGDALCQNDELFPRVGSGIPFIASLNENGAKKIWTEEKTATLIGSPAFSGGQ